ncbi:hypothetical protein [Salirhabdus salicampi]|uniref:hypothetical protein n=1 Tax=Salirhabdus salicampi TaxID=476102 RepID=UPI0020C2A302|nr:hypothetical protein [Salirhabdus salicampi]MCP8615882.1 hypothetical protein [Salirhabdus salicampi]
MKGRSTNIKIFILSVFILFFIGCKNNTSTTSNTNSEFTYSFEMDVIEQEDKDKILKWLNESDQTPTRIYEINDETNNRHYIYAHSKIYSEVDVGQSDEKIIVTFKNEKVESSIHDTLVKIKINPDKMNSVVLKTE